MKVSQSLFTYKGLSASFFVTDGQTDGPKGSLNCFKYYKSGMYINYSMYLSLSLKFENEDGGEETESFTISFFDVYQFKRLLKELMEVLEKDFYEEFEHIEAGTQLRIKSEYRKVFKMTNYARSNQLGFIPKIAYNKKEDYYYPAVKVIINRDDTGVLIPLEVILSILQNLKDIDFHLYATNLLTLYVSNKNILRNKHINYTNSIED